MIVYRPDGQASKQEYGTVLSQSDTDWTGMSVVESALSYFDSDSRVYLQRLFGGSSIYAQTEIGYDAIGRAECSAVRMNSAAFGSTPGGCVLNTEGSQGPDRITRTIYNAAGEATQVRVGVGTPTETAERSMTYTSNGQLEALTDAENNRTTYEYDAHDRLSKTRFPSLIKGAGTSSTADYEQLTYEVLASGTSGLVASRRLRDGQVIGFAYDYLARMTTKDLPGNEPDVSYGHDLLGRLKSASQTGNSLWFSWDALGRNIGQGGPLGSAYSAWDLAGRRTRLTYPNGGLAIDYDYLVTGETTSIRENGATSGAGVLATYAYDDLGRRTSLTRGNTAVTTYIYDGVSRLRGLTQNLAGTADDLSIGNSSASISYNPASQIVAQPRFSSNTAYSWTDAKAVSLSHGSNGLNQYTQSGATYPKYDARGNLNSADGITYTYNSENMLVSTSAGASLAYDPLLRLYQTAKTPTTTKFGYDGLNLIAEYSGSNALLRRYVFGPGPDEPLVQYEGSGTTDRRWLHADERGSIIAITDGTGTATAINSYDEFGLPNSDSSDTNLNSGRFQYTGQTWIDEIGLYHYKARMYSPKLGRFFQTDPIGYGDGMNMYAYVGNDPVNFTDPLGLVPEVVQDILVIGPRRIEPVAASFMYIAVGAAAAFGDRGSNDGGGDDQKPQKEKGRDCSAFQRGAEKFADAAADISAWSLNLTLGAEVVGGGMAKFGAGRVAKLGATIGGKAVAGQLAGASAISGGLSLIGYAASGQSGTAIYNKAVSSTIDHTLGRFSGPAGKWVTDKVTSAAQDSFDKNRCAP